MKFNCKFRKIISFTKHEEYKHKKRRAIDQALLYPSFVGLIV